MNNITKHNDEKYDISVIIPIYNTEDYISDCVNSVLEQTGNASVEIILVNDGSKDNSLTICKQFEKKYQNIKVVNQDNAGASMARNAGFKISSGDYILFLDGDDYYLPIYNEDKRTCSLVDLLYLAKRKSIDVLCFNYTREETYEPERFFGEEFSQDIYRLVNENVYTSSACIKMIRRSLLLDNDISFVQGALSEDILFSGKLLTIKDASFAFYNKVIYFYRVREGSITKSFSKKHALDILNTIEILQKSDNKNVHAYNAFQYATLLVNIGLSNDVLDDDLLKKIYSYKYLLKNNNSKVVKTINISTKIIGVRLTAKLLSVAFKLKEKR